MGLWITISSSVLYTSRGLDMDIHMDTELILVNRNINVNRNTKDSVVLRERV